MRTADKSLITKTRGLGFAFFFLKGSLCLALENHLLVLIVGIGNFSDVYTFFSFSTENLQGKKLNVQDNMKTSQIHQLHH